MRWKAASTGAPEGMRRYQLFEFLDQAWLPAALRRWATSYLMASYKLTPFPAIWSQMMARVLDECGLDRIVDLGSGSGGPMGLVMSELAKTGHRPRVTLTDLYPVRTATAIAYWPEPVNAVSVPSELRGLRTLFLSFHHFAPATARAVLRDAFEQRQPICVFEATSRTAPAIAVSFFIPFLVWLVTPWVRPFSGFQIFFTYLVPAVPLLAFWDGLVSQLRTYTMTELKELSSDLVSADYSWEYGYIDAPRVPFRTCYLTGCPKPGIAA